MPEATVRLLGPAEIRATAAAVGLRPSKQRGQNFVIDPNTIRRLVALAELEPGETVTEIGPGLGSLTLGLLAAGHPVVAVEVDEALADQLPATVRERAGADAPGLTVRAADAMTLTGTELGGATACVANLPYNVSVPVLLQLWAVAPAIRHGLVMVQAEVADRLAAPPGSRTYGVPSVKAAWYAELRRVGSVGRSVFWPVPNVDSGLVRFVRRDPPAVLGGPDRVEVFAVVDAAFAQRRKTLRTALLGWAGDRDRLDAILAAADIDPGARGETLDVVAFARIAAAGSAAGSAPTVTG